MIALLHCLEEKNNEIKQLKLKLHMQGVIVEEKKHKSGSCLNSKDSPME